MAKAAKKPQTHSKCEAKPQSLASDAIGKKHTVQGRHIEENV
jgi:hypothetical protein